MITITLRQQLMALEPRYGGYVKRQRRPAEASLVWLQVTTVAAAAVLTEPQVHQDTAWRWRWRGDSGGAAHGEGAHRLHFVPDADPDQLH